MAGNCFALRFGLTCMSRKHHRFVKQLTANSLSGLEMIFIIIIIIIIIVVSCGDV